VQFLAIDELGAATHCNAGKFKKRVAFFLAPGGATKAERETDWLV
jgi:hypothetical protein